MGDSKLIKGNQDSQHGGKRPGAGRKLGSVTRKTREIAEKAHETGLTPLEVMLGTMRALWEKAETGAIVVEGEGKDAKIYAPLDLRIMAADVAQKAAPFVHAKLASVEVAGRDGGPIAIQAITRRIIKPQ